jgi:hypothetical protein
MIFNKLPALSQKYLIKAIILTRLQRADSILIRRIKQDRHNRQDCLRRRKQLFPPFRASGSPPVYILTVGFAHGYYVSPFQGFGVLHVYIYTWTSPMAIMFCPFRALLFVESIFNHRFCLWPFCLSPSGN